MLSKSAEGLLSNLIENEGNIIGYLKEKFRNFKKDVYIDGNEENELRDQLKELSENDLISEMLWADNAPQFGRLTPKGLEYFDMKKSTEDKIRNLNYNDNSINIGNGTQISKSQIGHNSKNNKKSSKLLWQIFIPLAITVVGGIITGLVLLLI